MNLMKKQLDKDIKYIKEMNTLNYNDNIWGLDMEVLEEAYFGSKPEFKEIEKLLGVIIDRINSTFGPYTGNALDWFDMEYKVKDMRLYNDDTVSRIEKLFEKAFGLKEFHLDFYYNSFVVLDVYDLLKKKPLEKNAAGAMGRNAFTIPQGFALFDKSNDTENKMIRDGANIKAGVFVGVDLIWTLQLTPREVMAVILHELGHDMDASIFTLLASVPRFIDGNNNFVDPKTFAIASGLVAVLKSSPLGAWLAKANKEYDEMIENSPGAGATLGYIATLIKTIKDLVTTSKWLKDPVKAMTWFKNIDPRLYMLNVMQPNNLFGYGSEKFADSFATSYGYGLEIASFNRKVQLRSDSIPFTTFAQVPGINLITDFILASKRFVNMMLDPHPHDATRMYRQLAKLKKDLKDPSLPPSIRKDLERDIEGMQKYIDDVILNPRHDDNKKHFFTFLMNWMIIKIFNGRIDPRELFDSREL